MDGTTMGWVPPCHRAADTEQQDPCQAALNSHRAYSFLLDLLRGIPVSHPSFGPAAETLELVRAEWLRCLDNAGRLPASGGSGLLLKAAVLSRAIERDGADRVVGGPVLALAASLADDVLVRPGIAHLRPDDA